MEARNTREVGKVASVVDGGQVWAGPSFRCPCRWRGCDSSSGRRLRWGRSCSPRGRWTRCLQMAVVAALWGLGPQPGPRSLGVCGGNRVWAGELRGYGLSSFPNLQTPPLAQGLSLQHPLHRACSEPSALPGRGGGWWVQRRPSPCTLRGPWQLGRQASAGLGYLSPSAGLWGRTCRGGGEGGQVPFWQDPGPAHPFRFLHPTRHKKPKEWDQHSLRAR